MHDDPDALLERLDLDARAPDDVPPPVGRRTAPAVARARARRATRRRVPRRADRGDGRRGPRGDVGRSSASCSERGTTVVLTTHLLDEAERIADRVAILHHGRARRRRDAGRARADRSSGDHADDDDADRRRRVRRARRRHASRRSATLPTASSGEPATPELVARITAWLSARRVLVRTLHVGARSLEEVYLELTR